jgi:hypothetical protein
MDFQTEVLSFFGLVFDLNGIKGCAPLTSTSDKFFEDE